MSSTLQSTASSDPQTAALDKFDQLSFFLLSKLPPGSEFGLDSKLWTVNKFGGVKFLPAGLHFFVFSAAPSSSSPETISSGVGVRHGLFRFFTSGETVTESWNNAREELESDPEAHKHKRRRVEAESEEAVEVVSPEYLKGLDETLAPYPADLEEAWTPLVSYITPATLARVVGVDERGMAKVDAVMGSAAEEKELEAAGGRRTWGKEREEEELVPVVVEEGEEVEEGGDLLRFLEFDTKRSWPKGAVGEELTRWSKDKSWLLAEVVKTQLSGDVKELLAELQLSFTLFTLLHNFSSLTSYKSHFSLLCRSSSLLLPTTTLLPSSSLPLYASFLALFHSQLSFLDTAFFSDQMPGLDIFLLGELDVLCTSLAEAGIEWNAKRGGGVEVWKRVCGAWEAVAEVGMEKFGWELGMVRRRHPVVVEKEDDEVDFEDLEEGEDAPVIVEM